jgi:hypothetical protein
MLSLGLKVGKLGLLSFALKKKKRKKKENKSECVWCILS